MKMPELNVEAIMLAVLGCALLLLGGSEHFVWLSPTENPYLWARSGVVGSLLLGYGTVLVGMSLWSVYLASRETSAAREVSRHARNVCALIRDDLLPALHRPLATGRTVRRLVIVLSIGIAVRVYFLTQPMRYDEAYTFLTFVNGHVLSLFDYPYPNNHVLHTIWVKLSTMIWGAHPLSIRLPAFVAGIASIPLMLCLARTLSPERSATFAMVVIAVFPYLVLYSTNARGYSMVVLLTLAMIWVGARTAQSPSVAASAILSLIAAFALATIPSTAFAIAGIYLWYTCLLLINGNKLKPIVCDSAVPCAVMTAGLTALLYTPVIFVARGIEPLIDNEYVKALPSDEFFSQLYPHIETTLGDFARDIPAPIFALCLALMAIGIAAAAKKREWPIVLLLPSALVASAVLLLVKHAIPFPRTWIFLIPIAIVLANAGFSYCLEALPAKPQRLIKCGMIACGAVYALFLIRSEAIATYPDTGAFPQARRVAEYLEPLLKEGDEVHASVPADYPTYFYLWYNGLREFRADEHPRDSETKYFVVQKSGYLRENPIQGRIGEPVQKLFDLGDAAVFQNIR